MHASESLCNLLYFESTECEALSQRLLCRNVRLDAASNQEIPGIFLHRLSTVASSMEVKFAVKLVDRLDRTISIDRGETADL